MIDSDTPKASKPTWGAKIAAASAVIFAIVVGGVYLADWIFALQNPYSFMYEGPMLQLGEMVASGKNIYDPAKLVSEPWMICIYPPLYLLCAGLSVKLFGITYFPLRIFSMLCCVASAALSYRIFRWSDCNRPVSAAASAFFLSFNAVYGWTYVARPDMLVTFLCILLLERFMMIMNVPERINQNKYLLLLSGLSSLALFAKQQAAVFIIAISLFLLSSKHTKSAAKYFVFSIGLSAFFFLIAQMLTSGFFQHLSFLSLVKTDPQALIANIAGLGFDWFKVLFALICIPLSLVFLKGKADIRRLPLLLFIISATVAYFSMSIPGSNINHLFPALFALTWLIGMMMSQTSPWLTPLVLLFACPSLVQISETYRYGPLLLPYAKKSEMELKNYDLKDKLVLTDDPNFNYMTYSKPVFEDCVTFLNVWANRKNGFDELNKQISETKFAAIIINAADMEGQGGPGWWPKQTVELIKNHYHKRADLYCSGWAAQLLTPTPRAEQ